MIGNIAGPLVGNVISPLVQPSSEVVIPAALWIDTSDATTVTTIGGNVSLITDKSGNGFDFADDFGLLGRPPYQLNSVNGLNSIEFTSTNQRLIAGSNYIFSDSDGLTLIAAVKPSGSPGGPALFFDFGDFSMAGYGIAFSTMDARAYVSTLFGGALLVVAGPFSTDVHILRMEVDFGNTLKLFIDGVQFTAAITLPKLTAAEINENPSRITSAGPMTIGKQSKTSSDTNRRFLGNFLEQFIYTQILPLSQAVAVETYLQRWVA